MVCTICSGAEHKSCSEASPLKCAWRGKMVTSLDSEYASIFEFGDHNSPVVCPGRKKLTLAQKAFCRDLAENQLRPMRIRHALSRKFGTPLEELPGLETVQNFVNHYGRTQIENHDRIQEITTWIRDHAYSGSETMTQPFTFAWDMDNLGKPIVGNGSDKRPFFGGHLKRDYTLRRRLKMGTLLRELSACCQDQSSSARAFGFKVCPAATLTRRVSELMREKLLGVAEDQDLDAVRAGACCIIRVISLPAPRIRVAPNKRSEEAIALTAQMGVNYARKEYEEQPCDGWPVDTLCQWCPCDYWFAFGACIHVLFALRVTSHVDSSGREVLINRRKENEAKLLCF